MDAVGAAEAPRACTKRCNVSAREVYSWALASYTRRTSGSAEAGGMRWWGWGVCVEQPRTMKWGDVSTCGLWAERGESGVCVDAQMRGSGGVWGVWGCVWGVGLWVCGCM